MHEEQKYLTFPGRQNLYSRHSLNMDPNQIPLTE